FGFGDSVTLSGVAVSGAAGITTGSGNDAVMVSGVVLFDNSTFPPGTIFIPSSFGSLTIDTGRGNTNVPTTFGPFGDSVTLGGVAVSGAASITTGSGNDTVFITGFVNPGPFPGSVSPSTFGALTIDTGKGNDAITLQDITAAALSVKTGDGFDTVEAR